MIVISGYTITKLLYDKGDSLIYHGYRESGKRNVVIKVLKEEKPSVVSLAILHHEFKILDYLHGDGTLPVIELKEEGNRLSIIQEDFGSFSLKEFMRRGKKVTAASSLPGSQWVQAPPLVPLERLNKSTGY